MTTFGRHFLWSLVALYGCGGGGGGGGGQTPPATNSEAIPEQLFRVDLTKATNNCGAGDAGSISFLVLPKHTGAAYTVLGIGNKEIPATVTGDKMTFTATFPVTGGTVTFTADWTFAPGRHTFSGTFTDDVRKSTSCIFTFAAAGLHVDALGKPVIPAAAMAHDLLPTIVKSNPHVTGLEEWFGTTGGVGPQESRCQDAGLGAGKQFQFIPAGVLPRGSTPEYAAIEFAIYGSTDITTALTALDAVTHTPDPLSDPAQSILSYRSQWYWTKVNPNGFGDDLLLQQWWAFDNTTLFIQTVESQNFSLTPGAFYFGILDVYWYGPPVNPSFPAGWYRTAIQFFGGGTICQT